MDFSFWGYMKEHLYAVPRRTMEDFVGILQAAATMVDANMFRRVRENSVQCTAVCLK
jgi:hypothetical protein